MREKLGVALGIIWVWCGTDDWYGIRNKDQPMQHNRPLPPLVCGVGVVRNLVERQPCCWVDCFAVWEGEVEPEIIPISAHVLVGVVGVVVLLRPCLNEHCVAKLGALFRDLRTAEGLC